MATDGRRHLMYLYSRRQRIVQGPQRTVKNGRHHAARSERSRANMRCLPGWAATSPAAVPRGSLVLLSGRATLEPGGGAVSRRQTTVQAAPLSVNAGGRPALPVCVAWKPIVVDAPAGSTAL